MTPETVQQLLDRYISEELSREEFFALWQTLSQDDHRTLWEQQIDHIIQSGKYDDLAEPQQQQAVLAAILREETGSAPVRRMPSKRVWWAAASVIMMLSVCGYLWFAGKEKTPVAKQKTILPGDVAPGTDGAILTLADGSQVVLDSMKNGLVAMQNGSKVVLKNNELTYAEAGTASNALVYNTLNTPNGRQFHVELPDGTEVWLNAASSIRYPTVFAGPERKVTITGEAYFEVAKNPAIPFVVDVNGKMSVQVLGTHFNINAYTNEPDISTTLLEGSVRIINASSNTKEIMAVLIPGQQAQVKEDQISVINNADISMAIAWKEGTFRFNYTPLKEILRQFARWYDVEVVYEGKAPDFVLSGAIRRDFTLTEALLTLEKMGLRYRIDNKKLIILP